MNLRVHDPQVGRFWSFPNSGISIVDGLRMRKRSLDCARNTNYAGPEVRRERKGES